MALFPIERPPFPVLVIWGSLAVALIVALATQRWPLAFVSIMTFVMSLLPLIVVRRLGIRLPPGFTVATVAFIYATIFLGEAFDFYERYAWWDIAMHGGSAMGFGMIGFLFAFFLFAGDRYAAPAWALSTIGLAFAITIGTIWEIFEFAMDQTFGLNMQKSGLMDTMGDLIVNLIGASLGALASFLYLKGQEFGGLAALIADFVHHNQSHFQRRRRRRRGDR